jgi:D-aminopeptidase
VIEQIRAATRRAAENLDRMQTFAFDTPMEFQIRYKRIEHAEATANQGSPWRRVDAYTVARTMDSILDYF